VGELAQLGGEHLADLLQQHLPARGQLGTGNLAQSGIPVEVNGLT
jgi:hypothetical protein